MFVKKIKRFFTKVILNVVRSMPETRPLMDESTNSTVSRKAKMYPVYKIYNSIIQDYTYIAQNSIINNTTIGKFCSIGANFISGWGIHPTVSVSTSPMFYSTQKQNGFSLSPRDKIEETKPIIIGSDVFIGMNVTVLDGVIIGDGAVIGAGAVVSKNIPPYAIAIGNPIQIKRYRFTNEQIKKFLLIKWWNWDDKDLVNVENYFDDIDKFLEKFS